MKLAILAANGQIARIVLQAFFDGKINPGKVFTKSFSLDDIQDAYQAMDKREAIKSLLIISE